MIETEQRSALAVSYFKEGYNCSQAVFMAYSDLYGIEKELAAKLATSFGGGMGRLREVCGAVSAMFLVLGLEYPFIDTNDKTSKNKNYKIVQQTAKAFKQKMGSIICADLLNVKREPSIFVSSARTKEYYESRPCEQCVATSTKIVGDFIFK